MNILNATLDTFRTGGGLMIPLAAITFALWYVTIATCLAIRRNGLRDDTAIARLRTNSRMVAALVAAAPLTGLLGTVVGMIETFQAVSAQTDSTAPLVAGGISKALVTTQAGLVTAIPGGFALLFLHKRLKAAQKT